jgi:hypothetical protein
MMADSAKHAEMEQLKQNPQRFHDLWFSEKTHGYLEEPRFGIVEFVAENFVSRIPIPGVSTTGIQQISVTIHGPSVLRSLGCFAPAKWPFGGSQQRRALPERSDAYRIRANLSVR